MTLRALGSLLCVLLVTVPASAQQEGGYAPVEPDPPSSGGSAKGGGGSSDTRAAELMPPSTRPMFFVGAVGPTFFGINRSGQRGGPGPGGPGGTLARAKIALEFGYHLSETFEGPAIGAALEQSFDGQFYVLNPSFKFWWDIQIVDDYAIYVTPWAKAGYALRGACRGCPDHAFNIGLGAEGRVVFKDRWIVLFRPIHIDTYLGNFDGQGFWLNYSLLVGGGVAF